MIGTMRRRDGSRRRLPLLTAGMLCYAAAAFAAAPDPAGEWSGRLSTTGGTCPEARAPSRLVVGATNISFVPANGVLVLHGIRKPDSDRLHAQLLLTDMNKKPLPMVFEGSLSPDGKGIDATYGTPTCRARVTLLRPEHHAFGRLLGH